MRVVIYHQRDPGAAHVGGIQTFLNTFNKHAPEGFSIDLVGVTTDPDRRPVGVWQEMQAGGPGRNLPGGRPFRFLPVIAARPNLRGLLPVTFRLAAGIRRHWGKLDLEGAVLEIHRVELALAIRGLRNPKVLFLHAHSKDFSNPKTEALWGKLPAAYQWLEAMLIGGMDHIYIVREDAVKDYQDRYPGIARRISFLPTWVDEDVFVSLPEAQRGRIRAEMGRRHGFLAGDPLLLFVGRFEGQKDPMRLLESLLGIRSANPSARLVMIGEGKMEPQIRQFVAEHHLEGQVRLLGPQPQTEVARWMNAADLLVLASAYEGMPRVVVEALHAGLPVCSTDAGEARRLIGDSAGGQIVAEPGAEAFGKAVLGLLGNLPSREACREQAAPFTARRILVEVYTLYEKLAARRP
jgi:glycosyltransferase involved in cell wall biosynthesis